MRVTVTRLLDVDLLTSPIFIVATVAGLIHIGVKTIRVPAGTPRG